MSLLSFWEFWLTDRKSAQCLRNGRIQSPELFLFAEIQKWACYPGGSSCFPCSSASWQGLDPWFPTLSPLPTGPLPLSVALLNQSIPQPGKSAQPAVETDWLRRRPGRCTEDKFVFVSWAVTLSSRTLTRSCQREGRREPGTAAIPSPTAAASSSNRPSCHPAYRSPAGRREALWSRRFPLQQHREAP